MKKSALIISVLFLTVGNIAISQVLEFDWYKYAKVNNPWLQVTENIMASMDNDGNLIMVWAYNSSIPLEFCGHFFPVDNYSLYNNDDTFRLVKISPTGQYLWDVDTYATYCTIAHDNENSIYIFSNDERYKAPFYFASNWVYSYDSTYSTNHRTLLKYDENGTEQWGKILSSTFTIGFTSLSKVLHGGYNDNVIVDCGFKGHYYLEDTLLGIADSNKYHYCIIDISSNGNINWVKNFYCNSGSLIGRVKKVYNNGNTKTIISVPSQDSLFMDSSLIYYNSTNSVQNIHIIINTNGDIISQIEYSNSSISNTGIFEIDENGFHFSTLSMSAQYATYGTDTIYNPNPGSNALAIIMLDSSMNLVWSSCYNNTYGYEGIAIDDSSNLYLCFGSPDYILFESDTIFKNNGVILSILNKSGESIFTGSIAENTGITFNTYHFNNLHAINPDNIILTSKIPMFDTVFLFDDTITLNYPNLSKISSTIFGMSIKYPEYTKQQINFPQGWSLFSTYINPDSLDISNVLAPAADSLELVKDENGLVYWPSWGINLIGDITKGEGYQAYANNSCSVQITGYEILPEITPLELTLGWSMLGYLRQSPGNIDAMLTTIAPQIIIVKDEFGDVYWPTYGINYIGDMLPGEGYLIKTISNTTLTYPAN